MNGIVGRHSHGEGAAFSFQVDLFGGDGEHLLRPGLLDIAGEASTDFVAYHYDAAALRGLGVGLRRESIDVAGQRLLLHPIGGRTDVAFAVRDYGHLDVASFGPDFHLGRIDVHHVHEGRGGLAAGLGRDG